MFKHKHKRTHTQAHTHTRLELLVFSFCSAALIDSEPPPPLLSSTPTKAWWCADSTELDFQTISLPFQRTCCCLMDLQAVACYMEQDVVCNKLNHPTSFFINRNHNQLLPSWVSRVCIISIREKASMQGVYPQMLQGFLSGIATTSIWSKNATTQC